jgi:hypothetical protein
MSRIPPTRPAARSRPAAALVVLIAGALVGIATVAAGCATQDSVGGLLVATGGPLRVTDAAGALVRFDGPADPVVAVSASDGSVVATTADGTFLVSNGSSPTRAWRPIAVPLGEATDVRLMAVSPLGRELAVVVGDPQGTGFDVVLVDIGLGTTRSFAVDRGLNGGPSWIGPDTIALDVIKADGESGQATIEIHSGTVTDDALDGRVSSATYDRVHLAVDDPTNGDVLVGVGDGKALRPMGQVSRLPGPDGSSVESLSIDPGGSKLAVVRRTEDGSDSIEIYRSTGQGWRSVRTIAAGDGPVSIAWLE